MYFQLKNTLKNNNYHHVKHYLILGLPSISRDGYQIKEYSQKKTEKNRRNLGKVTGERHLSIILFFKNCIHKNSIIISSISSQFLSYNFKSLFKNGFTLFALIPRDFIAINAFTTLGCGAIPEQPTLKPKSTCTQFPVFVNCKERESMRVRLPNQK